MKTPTTAAAHLDRRTITATEAQQYLGINAARIRKWASRQRIFAVSIGPDGARWYRLEDVLELAARG